MVYDDITELIGKTPLLKLNRYSGDKGFKAEIYAKLEYFNPSPTMMPDFVLKPFSFA